MVGFQIIRDPIFQETFGQPNNLRIDALRIGEIARIVEISDDAVLGRKSAGRDGLVVAVMADPNLHLVQIINILASQIDHQGVFIQVADLLDAMFPARGMDFDQAAFLQLLICMVMAPLLRFSLFARSFRFRL